MLLGVLLMGLLWVVCGAGRGVGKTTLALKLCEVLPRSVYAKYGHGRPKAGKPGNYFTRAAKLRAFVEGSSAAHIVVECNAWAREGGGDVAIYIEGVKGKTRVRKDAEELRARADLKISPSSSQADWGRVLRERLSDKPLRGAVRDVLAAQKRLLFGVHPKACSKVWFELADSHVFGSGLARLLENVDRSGSLRQAARAADMSYRYAWDLVRRAEKHLDKALVEKHAGGPGGGGSKLTAEGRHMLNVFRHLSEEIASFAEQRFQALYHKERANV